MSWVDWLIWSGPSQTSTPIPHWFRSREWTPRRKLGGTPESAWLISTRLRWRRTGATTVAFGERFPGHTVTPALFVPSSLPICPPNPWYSLNWNYCLISVTLYNGFCSIDLFCGAFTGCSSEGIHVSQQYIRYYTRVWFFTLMYVSMLFFACLHVYNGNIVCAVSVWFWIPMWISLKDSTVIWCMKMLLSLCLQLLSLYKFKVKIARCYWVFELLLICFQWKILVKLLNAEIRERT